MTCRPSVQELAAEKERGVAAVKAAGASDDELKKLLSQIAFLQKELSEAKGSLQARGRAVPAVLSISSSLSPLVKHCWDCVTPKARSNLSPSLSLSLLFGQSVSSKLSAELQAKAQAEKVPKISLGTAAATLSVGTKLTRQDAMLSSLTGPQVLAETKKKQMELISTLKEDIMTPEEVRHQP